MTTPFDIAFVLLSPLVGVLLLPLVEKHRKIFFAGLLLIPLLNTALLASAGVHRDPVFFGVLAYSLDRFSFTFGVLLNVCWALTIVYSMDFVRYHFQDQKKTFYGFFSVAISLIGSAGLSDNLLTLYLSYFLSIPIIFPLVTLRTGAESKKAGLWYLGSTVGPALGIALPALIFVNQWLTPFQSLSIRQVTSSDTVASLVLAALIVGFSKNCVAPFFGWLPRTSVAPAPVTGLIHSVGAVHTGTLAVLKIIAYLYGYSYMSSLSQKFFEAGWLIYLCGFTSLYTAICAYRSRDLKKRFSYSTVGQLSYVITAGLVGTPGALLGAILHIASHSVAKLNLFFVAGTFNSVYETTDAGEVAKIIPNVRWLAVAVGVSGLSITGFPFLAGYYSKDLMLLEELAHHQYAAAGFLLAGSILNFLYIFPVLKAAFRKRQAGFEKKTIPPGQAIAIAVNTVLIILVSIYTAEITRVVR